MTPSPRCPHLRQHPRSAADRDPRRKLEDRYLTAFALQCQEGNRKNWQISCPRGGALDCDVKAKALGSGIHTGIVAASVAPRHLVGRFVARCPPPRLEELELAPLRPDTDRTLAMADRSSFGLDPSGHRGALAQASDACGRVATGSSIYARSAASVYRVRPEQSAKAYAARLGG